MGKQKREAKKSFAKHLEYWKGKLGLYAYKIDTNYYDGSIPDSSGPKVAALITCDWRYMTAAIDVSLSNIKTMSDKEIEAVVIHELFHAIVDEMDCKDKDHEERVVTILTSIVGWVRSAGHE